jgi:predicted lipid-binding transport protein (Tim44 family)
MKRLFILTVAIFLGISLATDDAEAKRLGGGRSVGKQRESLNQPTQSPAEKTGPPAQQATPQPQQGAPQPQAAPRPQAPAPAAAGSRWAGPLAGLAAGGLLAALFFGGAFDGIKPADILMLLAIAAVIFFIVRALRAKPRPRNVQYAGVGADATPSTSPDTLHDTWGAAAPKPNYPPGFDVQSFVKIAKQSFVRLQSAHDKSDLDEIRDYMTPELFEALRPEIEKASGPHKTEVLTLDAKLLDVATEGDFAIASVRFSGLIREDSDQAQPFDEIWNVEKRISDPKAVWLVCGIQQASSPSA